MAPALTAPLQDIERLEDVAAGPADVLPRRQCDGYDSGMDAHEDIYARLRQHIGRRPFSPFRVTLKSGEAIDISRTAQAVAMKRRLIVATRDDVFRQVWLEEIDRVEAR